MVMKIPIQSYFFDSIVGVTLYLFLVSFVIQTLSFPAVHYCRHDQRDALLEFKHDFPVNESYSTANYMISWNKSSDCCSWEGVMCDARSGKVISLRFVDVFLNNTLKLNSGLFKLQYLQYLILASCNLIGEIPSSFGNLSHLMVLDLTDNKLEGQVPGSIGNLNQLRSLSLSGNKLSGNIPISFCNLTKSSTLFLDNNYFENSFFSPFPMSLLMNPSLQVLNIERNQFSGPIEFVNTSSSRLYVLYAAHNKFNGSIPDSISKLPNLSRLDLSYNDFFGKIPISISQLVKLSDLDFSNNKLEGKVPSCFWKLTVLKLSQNSFSSLGKLPKVVDLIQMSVLSLGSNMFRGPFPHWICKFQLIEILDLSNNSFTGSIPQCLRNITNFLQVLNLENNNFSGILPDVFDNATNLNTLGVSRNQFEGKLPKSLIYCKAMRLLNVQSNRFEDKFPSWMGSLQSLNVLILRSNRFYGPLYHQHVFNGFQSLKVIDVSHNNFSGTFPASYFSKWQGMTTLNTNNEDTVYMEDPILYWDSYHNSMEMVHKGVDTHFEEIRNDFIAIDFSGNKFYGKIPDSIGLLKGLRLLNLSSNAFTSNIPKSMVMLTNLEALDLSQNHLTGQIPRGLGILSFLSKMNFSHNNLKGPIPRGTQFQSQKCSSFMENPRLKGLEDICGKAHVFNPTLQTSEAFLEKEDEVINLIAAAIAYAPGVFCGLLIGHIFVSHKHEWLMENFHRIKYKIVIITRGR